MFIMLVACQSTTEKSVIVDDSDVVKMKQELEEETRRLSQLQDTTALLDNELKGELPTNTTATDASVKLIDDCEKKLSKVNKHYQDEKDYWIAGDFVGYIYNEQLVKLVDDFSDEGYSTHITYYFKKNILYYAFVINEDQEGNIDHRKLYFKDDLIYEALFRTQNMADGGNINTKSFGKDSELFKELKTRNQLYISMKNEALKYWGK